MRKRSAHPAPWELNVQSAVRALKVPANQPDVILLGEDDAGLAAVAMFGAYPEHTAAFYVYLIAAAHRHRRPGGGAIGTEALEVIRSHIRGLRPELEEVFIFAKIHTANAPSQRLFGDHGFARTTRTDGDLEIWGGLLPLSIATDADEESERMA